MGDVVGFRRKHRRRQRAEGKTLCANGLHRWQVEAESRFDVKQGRLVSLYLCRRCGARRSEAR